MAAPKLTLELDTVSPLWSARQFLDLLKLVAAETGYEVTDHYISSFTVELSPLGDEGDPAQLRSALDHRSVLGSVSLREHGK